jgi:hypothetical protein
MFCKEDGGYGRMIAMFYLHLLFLGSGFESRLFLKTQRMGDIAREWPTHSCPTKKYTKKIIR